MSNYDERSCDVRQETHEAQPRTLRRSAAGGEDRHGAIVLTDRAVNEIAALSEAAKTASKGENPSRR